MAIKFTDEQIELLYNNGFTDEDIQYTIDEDRKNGLKDSEIQKNILKSIGQYKFNPLTATPEEVNDKYKELAEQKLAARDEWEANHPVISRMQADYQPGYRAERTALENQAKFGMNAPLKDLTENIATQVGQASVPYINTLRDYYLTQLTKGKAGFIPNIARAAGIGALQSATSEGLDELSNNGLSQDVLNRTLEGGKGGGIVGGSIAAAANTIPYVGRPIAKGMQKVIENPKIQDLITSGMELMTSVPKRSSQIALENELAGTSILNKPFDARTAYQPIEKMVKKAKGMLPTPADFGNDYYKLGQNLLQNMDNMEQKANIDIANALDPLSNKLTKTAGIRNAVDTAIKKFANGGDLNPAEIKASKDLVEIRKLLANPETKLINLHNAKELLYDTANYETAGGIRNKALKQVANQINNYLRGLSPAYSKANDIASLVKEVTKGLDSQSTMGSKLKNIGSVDSALSGMDQRLKAVDNLLPQQNKFYKQAQNIIENENEINNIRNQIGKVYERNPRLLLNKTDDAFNQAFEDLQTKTGVNIRKPLEQIQAREHFSKPLPGQGGGSGGTQGAGNLGRAQVVGKAVEKAMQGDFRPLAMTALMSPLIGGKGTIYNLGKLYNTASNILKTSPKDMVNESLLKAAPIIGEIASKFAQR